MTDRVPLPSGISRQDLLAAIEELTHGLPDGYKDSTGYDVYHEGKRYPPKPIVGLAASALVGFDYRGKHFTGGLGSKCFQILEQNGFVIVTKSGQSPYPDEVEDDDHSEGAVTRITVNRYERDAKARDKCIDHYGAICSVCGFDFRQKYGVIGEGFIHVHHLVPISEIGASYRLDPIDDLRPVCPNCHAMLHKKKPPFTIAELSAMLD
jgi:5-methylcytosine-specific restriction protein A